MARKTKVTTSASYDEIIDSIEKDIGLVSVTSAARDRVSTGLLSLDLILCGGLTPGGWYTFFGGEQSSKSTLAMTQVALAAVWKQKLIAEGKETPFIAYFDYEGSFSPDYLIGMAHSMGFKGDITDMFGIQDENGKYIKPALVRRYQVSIAENFFDLQRRLQKELPDKMFRNGKWWKVYPAKVVDKKGKSKVVNEDKKAQADGKMLKRTGKYWIECDNGYPQAILVTDSYPAMLPKNIAEVDDNEGIAEQARMFSKELKKVKGSMEPKKVIVMGINQLRKVPMAMYGPSETEPCGTAIAFYSDARLKMTSRNSVFGNKGKEVVEDAVNLKKGKDIYRYINVKTIKNKLSVPDLETWLRIWVRNGRVAKGYDPVFDTLYFMGQVGIIPAFKESNSLPNKIAMDLSIIGLKGWPKKPKAISYNDFKLLVVGDKKDREKVLKKSGHTGKVFDLRKKLFSYVESGEANERYFENLAGKK